MEEILKPLQQAEHVHVLLNHLPIIGLLAGLLILVIAILQKNRGTFVAAYIVVGVMSLSVIPVTEYGEKAVDQVESLLDTPGRQWLREHDRRVEDFTWLYYITGGLAIAGLVLPRFAPKAASFLAWGTLLFGIGALCSGMWIASAGGKIMHREFRYSLLRKQKATDFPSTGAGVAGNYLLIAAFLPT